MTISRYGDFSYAFIERISLPHVLTDHCPRLRKAIFMPAIVARRYNSPIATFCARFTAKGKSKMSVIGAVMHKLLRQVFGVLKSQRSFDPYFVQIPS